MENLVPTSEEILSEYGFDGSGFAKEKARQMLIKFAQLHVQQALESAASLADTKTEMSYNGGLDPNKSSMYDEIQVIDEDSILNAYPLTNIK